MQDHMWILRPKIATVFVAEAEGPALLSLQCTNSTSPQRHYIQGFCAEEFSKVKAHDTHGLFASFLAKRKGAAPRPATPSHSRPKGARAKAATPLLANLETHPYNS